MRRLQLKQSQLTKNFYSNMLDRIKVCMNMSKAAFKEEKLRNQIKDTRHAELVKRCIDLLVSGLIIMCAFLIYAASIFSHQQITEATSPCMAMSREFKSWWMPKPMASLSSGWLMLRCHAVVITRMLFVTRVEKAVGIPYWVRRYTFYSILLLVLPIMAGLLPLHL